MSEELKSCPECGNEWNTRFADIKRNIKCIKCRDVRMVNDDKHKEIDKMNIIDAIIKIIKTTDDNEHMVQVRKAKSFLSSLPSDFFAGTINPIARKINRQILNIDTRFRDNYYSTQSSNIHIDLPIRFTQVVSLQLSALELPGTFYSKGVRFTSNIFSTVNHVISLV